MHSKSFFTIIKHPLQNIHHKEFPNYRNVKVIFQEPNRMSLSCWEGMARVLLSSFSTSSQMIVIRPWGDRTETSPTSYHTSTDLHLLILVLFVLSLDREDIFLPLSPSYAPEISFHVCKDGTAAIVSSFLHSLCIHFWIIPSANGHAMKTNSPHPS